ncbi:hypothetical protein FRC10_004121 [Ceratobasidium sp. 414]|nr:hypothetical protein FRC10_004121 [Ceratobasidium sp. 414]
MYGAALAHWKHVQQQLIQTIQHYVDACAALSATLATFPMDYSSRSQQAEAFAGLDSQLPFLASYEQRLHDARFSLKITRNTSQSLIPINSLPPEILDAIFILAVQQKGDAVCTLTSVCKLWRHLTLQSPACWSRIELPIGPEGDLAYERALLWAERAQNEPLYISVWERPFHVEDFAYGDEVARSVGYLTPLMPRVCAMFTDGDVELDYFVNELIACWVEHGTIGTAKMLEVKARGEAVTLEAQGLADSTVESFKVFFGSLHTLSLENAQLDWRLGFYSGLVNLHIGNAFKHASYSQWDIADVLAASPRLRSLAILGLDIEIDTRRNGMPGPVALNDLNALCLESSYSTPNLWTVLQMITSTSASIRMSLSFTSQVEFIPAARSFFERCKVTALHIANLQYYQSHPPASSLFTYMPHLKYLAIQNRSVFDETWHSTRPGGSSLDLWPQLDEVYLTDCNLDREENKSLDVR